MPPPGESGMESRGHGRAKSNDQQYYQFKQYQRKPIVQAWIKRPRLELGKAANDTSVAYCEEASFGTSRGEASRTFSARDSRPSLPQGKRGMSTRNAKRLLANHAARRMGAVLQSTFEAQDPAVVQD